MAWRGYPNKLRMDNGPELVSATLAEWAEHHDIELEFIKTGKPTQNACVERFNRTYRDEVLNVQVFRTLSEVREITGNWIQEYNEERPHDSLDDLTPLEYLATRNPRENSNYVAGMIHLLGRVLLALMLAEIIYTVGRITRTRQLETEPFLSVGIIAAIRRMPIITAQSAAYLDRGQGRRRR